MAEFAGFPGRRSRFTNHADPRDRPDEDRSAALVRRSRTRACRANRTAPPPVRTQADLVNQPLIREPFDRGPRKWTSHARCRFHPRQPGRGQSQLPQPQRRHRCRSIGPSRSTTNGKRLVQLRSETAAKQNDISKKFRRPRRRRRSGPTQGREHQALRKKSAPSTPSSSSSRATCRPTCSSSRT